MPEIALPPTHLRRALAFAAILSTAVAIAWGWGFTVDDALISTRVAYHLASGLGYRFNPGGPEVDCVTPLGWAWLLRPLSSRGVWSGLEAARYLGVLLSLCAAWVSAWVLGRHVRRLGSALASCLALLVCLPLGAWASAGMETPLVTLCVSLSLYSARSAPWFAAIASGLRPELLPWAFTLSLTLPANSPAQRTLRLMAALSGALAAALCRLALFGSVTPLAVLAKPSDATHGLVYLAFGVVQTGLPLLLIGTKAYARLPPPLAAHAAALLAHAGAIVIAGGDWMALYRLFVPVLPVVWVVGCALSDLQSVRTAALKLVACCAASLWLLVSKGADARGVWQAREQLVHGAHALLGDAQVIGALDVGWVSAATDQEIVDFAGLTDPNIALLPGGHTSKKLPLDLLWRRKVDTLILLTRADESIERIAREGVRSARLARQVEERVLRLDGVEEFSLVGALPLLHTTQHYLVLQRAAEGVASSTQCTPLCGPTALPE